MKLPITIWKAPFFLSEEALSFMRDRILDITGKPPESVCGKTYCQRLIKRGRIRVFLHPSREDLPQLVLHDVPKDSAS